LLDGKVERHRPVVLSPVVGGLRARGETRVGLSRVTQERLEKRGADVRSARLSADRPDVVHQRAVSPTRLLFKKNDGRTHAPFFGVEQVVAGGGKQKYRTCSPDPAVGSRLFR